MPLKLTDHKALLSSGSLLIRPETEHARHKDRYNLQDVAAHALPAGHRTCSCLRRRVSGDVAIEKTHGVKHNKLKNLAVCGSGWTCPVCYSRLAADDFNFIEYSISQYLKDFGRALFVTLTIPHLVVDSAVDLFKKHKIAEKKFKSGSKWTKLSKEIGLEGGIRVLENKYGMNGWHTHTHQVLLINNPDISTEKVKELLYNRWNDACAASGIGAISVKHGVDVKEITDLPPEQIANYLAKELSGAETKTRSDSLNAFDLLRVIQQSADKTAKNAAISLFNEYAAAVKGRRRINPTGICKKFKKDLENASKSEKEGAEITKVILALIKKDGWTGILKHGLRSNVARAESSLEIVHLVARTAHPGRPLAELVSVPGFLILGDVDKFAMLPSPPACVFPSEPEPPPPKPPGGDPFSP